LEIMRLSWMEKKKKKKKKKQSSPKRQQLWEGGGTKGYLTLHMNLLSPMAFQNLKRQTHSTRLLSPFNFSSFSSSSLEEVFNHYLSYPESHPVFTLSMGLLLSTSIPSFTDD
jgi:hypothetical protein